MRQHHTPLDDHPDPYEVDDPPPLPTVPVNEWDALRAVFARVAEVLAELARQLADFGRRLVKLAPRRSKPDNRPWARGPLRTDPPPPPRAGPPPPPKTRRRYKRDYRR